MEQENAIVSSYNSERNTSGGDRCFFTKYTKEREKEMLYREAAEVLYFLQIVK